MTPRDRIIEAIHASATRLVLAVTGGGSRAIAELLEVPGASGSVLEAVVPYCEAALTQWLGGRPDQFCAEPTARAMAMAAFLRAGQLDPTVPRRAGIAATASLASTRPKRGLHRAYVAVQMAERTTSRSVVLLKGRRNRALEERVVGGLVLRAVAEACGLDELPMPDLFAEERIEERRISAPQPWQELLLGRADVVRQLGDKAVVPDASVSRPSAAIYPGAFNPVHAGHRRMIEIAQDLLGQPVEIEISILNVDKPPLDYLEIAGRLEPFGAGRVVWLTRAARFEEKSRLFAGATFVIGADTLRRIADPRYYGNDPSAQRAAIERIAARGCRFLVFGRAEGGRFVGAAEMALPDPLRSLVNEVPESQFREDLSSTSIRQSSRRTDF